LIIGQYLGVARKAWEKVKKKMHDNADAYRRPCVREGHPAKILKPLSRNK